MLSYSQQTAGGIGDVRLSGVSATDGGRASLSPSSSVHTIRFTREDSEAEALQARCVGCLSLLVRRRAALDSLVSQPHAVTCVVAALDLRAAEAQARIVEVLMRIALLPAGLSMLMGSWDALRDREADELRLHRLVMALRLACSIELSLSLVRLSLISA